MEHERGMGVFEFNRIMFTLCLSEKKRILKREANISQIVWIGLDEGLSHSGSGSGLFPGGRNRGDCDK